MAKKPHAKKPAPKPAAPKPKEAAAAAVPGAPANAAIYYVREAFATDMPKLMGRNAAGASFLAGFARHGGVQPFLCCAPSQQEFGHFQKFMEPWGRSQWLAPANAQGLAEAGTLLLYAPAIADFCWQRRFASPAGWSVVGLTHTISSERVMDDLGALLTAPVERWDALVCASQSIKRTVSGVLEGYGAFLAERFNTHKIAPRLELPVIPLGVDCDSFAEGEKREQVRARIRERLGLKPADVAFLFLGRLSFHAKAHPLPMYLALEAAAKRTGRPLTLILAGYFFNAGIQKQFLDGAKLYCPSVRIVHFDGRKPEARASAWAAADVFTSFSDNIQESFGLAPLEAMAAGLPVVVSDWDGYRDTVVDGECGVMVPTAMPEAGHGAEFALRYLTGQDSYDVYIGNVGQCTAVDVQAAADAYVSLVENEALRRQMGEAGRKRARALFDWPVVVRAYQSLWTELAARRKGQKTRAALGHPLRDDPFRVFSAFPTRAIDGATRVERAAAQPLQEASRIAAAGMNSFALKFMLGKEEFVRLFQALPEGRAVRVRELQALFPEARRSAVVRAVGWLAKGGILRLTHG